MTTLAGTGTLVRLILRHDRLRLALWIGALVVVTIATTTALAKLVPTAYGVGSTPQISAPFWYRVTVCVSLYTKLGSAMKE
jgi:putative exporter of polyketide antibiotics